MENNREWKYNYILYNMENGYKWQMYQDLLKLDNVRMCRGALPMNEPVLHKFHKLHWSAKINKKINLPFKKLWFKKMTDGKFGNNKPTFFVLFGGQYALRDSRLCDYIRKLNPENKIAIHYRDLMKNEARHIDMLKDKTDLIYSYDKGECEKYGLYYYDKYTYSRLAETTEPTEFEYDLFFVGYAKDRLSLIHSVYNRLTSQELRCKFIIVNAPQEERLAGTDIEYLDSVIPYAQVIDYVLISRCILEITQEDAEGATMRTAEAILYKRKLLTNCNRASERPHYNSFQVSEFTCAENIDINFIRKAIPYEKLENINAFSPVNELIFLEEFFNNNRNGS